MSSVVLIIQTLLFAFALWLGLYLLAHVGAKPTLRLAGWGLLAYALALVSEILSQHSSLSFYRPLYTVFIAWPPVFWSGALVYWLPVEAAGQRLWVNGWRFGILPLAILSASLGAVAPELFGVSTALALVVLISAAYILQKLNRAQAGKTSAGLLLAAALFFSLSSGLLWLPFDWFSNYWVLLALGLDLVLLGVSIAWLDAFEEGETLWPDLVRSGVAAALMSILFGGLVLGAAFVSGQNLLALFLAILAAAIAFQTFSNAIQSRLDQLTFARSPQLTQARAELREAVESLPRLVVDHDPLTLDPTEFTRLTRRALSHLGNLPRLAANPLTQLPLVRQRLTQRGLNGNALERAAELKALLIESITRLKPNRNGHFGTTDEWRHYNALYYPYVVGLKPYARQSLEDLEPGAKEALTWLLTTVPERTLHNWQTAAARLVALDLREQHKVDSGSRWQSFS